MSQWERNATIGGGMGMEVIETIDHGGGVKIQKMKANAPWEGGMDVDNIIVDDKEPNYVRRRTHPPPPSCLRCALKTPWSTCHAAPHYRGRG